MMTHRKLLFWTFILLLCLIALPVRAQLVNPAATLEARQLKSFLDSVYGKKIISGHMDDSYLAYIQQNTGGKSPALMGYDFNGVLPRQSGNSDTEKAIAWVKQQGGIAQFQWHWVSPDGNGDFYTRNFNLAAALANPGGSSYKNLISDMDVVAGKLKILQDNGVPILWRPLHEAEGEWFWWGMSGGDACKALYRLMYDRFTHYHKLNNLIWVWNSYGTTRENWYPGDDVVDIIAYDYPDYSANGSWKQYQQMFGTRGKPFAIGENDKLPDPAIMTTQPWLYFMTWSYFIQEPTQTNGRNTRDWLYKVFNDPRVLTLADLQKGPKADAGIGRTLLDSDGNGFESVTLDGSGSSTDSGTITSYVWSENDSVLATGARAVLSLKSGIHTIILTITTSTNETKSASVVITVLTVSLSYKKKVAVSSTELNHGNVAANAVDANPATRWSSLYEDPQWYQIDLGKRYTIVKVVLNWEVAAAKEYRLEVSEDGTNWTTIASKGEMPKGARIDTLNNLGGSGRYIRMYGTARTTTYGYSLYEFEVYDDKWGQTSQTLPAGTTLLQNYPNPFNPATTISFYLKEAGQVKLELFNALGQWVATLADRQMGAGMQAIPFSGGGLAAGVYFYRLEVTTNGEKINESRKMLLIR
jgi:hypothetical protein